jgi:hypothetical protein
MGVVAGGRPTFVVCRDGERAIKRKTAANFHCGSLEETKGPGLNYRPTGPRAQSAGLAVALDGARHLVSVSRWTEPEDLSSLPEENPRRSGGKVGNEDGSGNF